jgi:hypothetical protein
MTPQSKHNLDIQRDPDPGPPHKKRKRRTSPSDLRREIAWNAREIDIALDNRRWAWEHGGHSESAVNEMDRRLARLYSKSRELRDRAVSRGIAAVTALDADGYVDFVLDARLENLPFWRAPRTMTARRGEQ